MLIISKRRYTSSLSMECFGNIMPRIKANRSSYLFLSIPVIKIAGLTTFCFLYKKFLKWAEDWPILTPKILTLLIRQLKIYFQFLGVSHAKNSHG